jgi:hypothetical protein
MQGSIAQIMALTIAGNAAAGGRDVSSFWPNASVFRFTKRCSFVDSSGTILEADPNAWLATTRSQCFGAMLHALQRNLSKTNDRENVGFVGGGPRWIMTTLEPNGTLLWEGRDRVSDKDDPERKIWTTDYVMLTERLPELRQSTKSVAEISTALRNTLREIADFAHEIQSDYFEGCFRNAIVSLSSDDPLNGLYHADIAALGRFPLQTARLFSATQHGWVFGAMGSWNDMAPDDPRYAPLSDKLFDEMVEAATVIANSTFPA